MPGFSRIRFERVSATKMYRSGDKGQPCRAPLVNFIGFEVWPLFVTMQLASVYSKCTHFPRPFPKFIFCITLSNNCQFRRSKAFSWSRLIIAIGNCF